MKLFEHEIEHEFKLKINNGQDSRKQGLWSDVAFSISHCQQQQSYSGLLNVHPDDHAQPTKENTL